MSEIAELLGVSMKTVWRTTVIMDYMSYYISRIRTLLWILSVCSQWIKILSGTSALSTVMLSVTWFYKAWLPWSIACWHIF